MPIYEYRCLDDGCGELTEEVASIKDIPNEVSCQKCGVPAKRIISASTFVLKGGGWYEDGYAKKS